MSLAAAALRARVDVEPLLAGEVLDGAVPKTALSLSRSSLRSAAEAGGRAQEHVRERGDDVEVLPVGEEVQEHEDHDDVQPEPGNADDLRGSGRNPAIAAAASEPAGAVHAGERAPARRCAAPSNAISLNAMSAMMKPRMRFASQDCVSRAGLVTTRRQRSAIVAPSAASTTTSFTSRYAFPPPNPARGRAGGSPPRSRSEQHDGPERQDEERPEDDHVEEAGDELLAIEEPALTEPEPEQRCKPLRGAIGALHCAQREERPEPSLHGPGEGPASRGEQERGEERAHASRSCFAAFTRADSSGSAWNRSPTSA